MTSFRVVTLCDESLLTLPLLLTLLLDAPLFDSVHTVRPVHGQQYVRLVDKDTRARRLSMRALGVGARSGESDSPWRLRSCFARLSWLTIPDLLFNLGRKALEARVECCASASSPASGASPAGSGCFSTRWRSTRGDRTSRGSLRIPMPTCVWSDRGHDGIERTASTWFKRYNGKAPERGGARKSREGRDREWLAGVVAMLHDVLEDADEEALAPVASWLSDEEAEALRLLTRERGSYDEYVERIATAGNRIAVLVKRREGADTLSVVKCRMDAPEPHPGAVPPRVLVQAPPFGWGVVQEAEVG